jgi:nucleoside phosphorylase
MLHKSYISVLFAVLLIVARCPSRANAGDRILIVTAVDYEYEAVAGLIRDRHDSLLGDRETSEGTIESVPVVAIRAGWGKAQAAGATSEAIEKFSPALVVMAGVAGGIDPISVQSGDIIVVSNVFQYDLGEFAGGSLDIWNPETPMEQPFPGSFVSSDIDVSAAIRAARTGHFIQWRLPPKCHCEKDGLRDPQCTDPEVPVGRNNPKVCSGTAATGDAFVADAALGASLVESRDAVIVDMESAAVAEEAADRGIPFVGIRVVGDAVGSPDNESFYYCLKPFAGPRLAETIKKVIPVLVVRPLDNLFAMPTSDANCRAKPSPSEKHHTELELRVLNSKVRPIRLR